MLEQYLENQHETVPGQTLWKLGQILKDELNSKRATNRLPNPNAYREGSLSGLAPMKRAGLRVSGSL